MSYQRTKSLTYRNSETGSYITIWPQTGTLDIYYGADARIEDLTLKEAWDLYHDLGHILEEHS